MRPPTQRPSAEYDEIKGNRVPTVDLRSPESSVRDERVRVGEFWVKVLLLLAIVLQRIFLPGLLLSITVVIMYGILCVLAARGLLRVATGRLLMFLVAYSVLALAAGLSSWRTPAASLNSFLFLALIYAPWALEIRHIDGGSQRRVALFFVRTMSVIGVVGFVQLTTQFAGVWRYQDYVGGLIPPTWQSLGYNTNNQIAWNIEIVKGQGFFFLEPSLLSQYCALAILLVVLLRLHWIYLVPLLLGMVGTLSGTGVLLLAFGFVAIVLTRPRAIRPLYVVVAVVGLIAVVNTPAGDLMLERRGEAAESGTSGSFRFVDPYSDVLEGLAKEPNRVVIGAGPGTSERLLTSPRGGVAAAPVVYTIPAKLLFEYGAVAATFFLVFFLSCLLGRGCGWGFGLAMAFMLFFLSGALLQPSTAVIAWALCTAWRPSVPLKAAARPAVEPLPAMLPVPSGGVRA